MLFGGFCSDGFSKKEKYIKKVEKSLKAKQ
jgi:hypothetical protein